MEPEDVVGVLLRETVSLTVAQQPPASGGAPSEPGLHVWWAPCTTVRGTTTTTWGVT